MYRRTPVQFLLQLAILFSAAVFSTAGEALPDLPESFILPANRRSGSAEERETIHRLSELLRNEHIPFEIIDYERVYSFDQTIPYTRSEVLYVPPTVENSEHPTLAVPVDQPGKHRFPDLTSGLQLAIQFVLNQPDRPFAVAFLGGEFYPDYQWGSAALAGSGFVDETTAVIYLAAFSSNNRPEIVTGSHGRISPRSLLETVIDTLDAFDVAADFPGLRTASYRLNRNIAMNMAGELLSKNIPTIGIEIGTPPPARSGQPNIPVAIGSHGYWDQGRTESTPESISPALGFALHNILSQPVSVSVWEELYGVITWFDTVFIIIPEHIYVISILFVLSLGFLVAAQKRRLFMRYIRAVTRHFWILIVMFALLFAALLLATWVIEIILRAREFQTLWEHYLLQFIFVKATSAVFIALLFIRIAKRLIHIPHGHFFSAAAVVSSFFSLAVISSITLAYAYSMLISFFCTVGFSVNRSTVGKGVFFTLAPLSLLIPLIGAVQAVDLMLINAALFSIINGNLLLSMLFLPFFLMGIRIHLMLHQGRKIHPAILIRFVLLINMFSAVALVIILMRVWPFNAESPQKVALHLSVEHDYSRHKDEQTKAILEISSDAPIQSPLLYLLGQRVELDGPHIVELQYRQIPDIFATVTTQRILQRQEVVLSIHADETTVSSVSYELTSELPIFFHYSDIPYRLTAGRTTAIFDFLPAAELPIDLVLVAAGLAAPQFTILTEFPMPPELLYTPDPEVVLTGTITYRGTVVIRDE